MKLSGTVIWYNPNNDSVINLRTYLPYIKKLYIVDNSDQDNSGLLTEDIRTKVEYIPNFQNLGIARALNIGCERAVNNKFEWILTMDQDSKFDNNFESFLKQIEIKQDEKIALFAPVYEVNGNIIKNKLRVFSSGNIINLKIHNKIGGFLDELFIDEVDHEMCYRIIENGYKILQLDDIILKHELGETEYKYLLKNFFQITNHNYIRRYYITRNKLYVKKLHPLYTKDYYSIIVKDFIKILFFEKNKTKKIKFIIKGIIDYKRKKMGKYEGGV